MLVVPVLDIPDIDIPERESRADWSEESHPRAPDGKFTSGGAFWIHNAKLDALINNHIGAAKEAASTKKAGGDVAKAATKQWQEIHAQLKKYAAAHPDPVTALAALKKAVDEHGKKDPYLKNALDQVAKAAGSAPPSTPASAPPPAPEPGPPPPAPPVPDDPHAAHTAAVEKAVDAWFAAKNGNPYAKAGGQWKVIKKEVDAHPDQAKALDIIAEKVKADPKVGAWLMSTIHQPGMEKLAAAAPPKAEPVAPPPPPGPKHPEADHVVVTAIGALGAQVPGSEGAKEAVKILKTTVNVHPDKGEAAALLEKAASSGNLPKAHAIALHALADATKKGESLDAKPAAGSVSTPKPATAPVAPKPTPPIPPTPPPAPAPQPLGTPAKPGSIPIPDKDELIKAVGSMSDNQVGKVTKNLQDIQSGAQTPDTLHELALQLKSGSFGAYPQNIKSTLDYLGKKGIATPAYDAWKAKEAEKAAKEAEEEAKSPGFASAVAAAVEMHVAAGFHEVDPLWGKQNYDKQWWDKLPADEKAGVKQWTSNGYVSDGKKIREAKGDLSKLPPELRKKYEALDAAMAKSVAPENIVIHRGLEFSGDIEDLKSKVGGIWMDHAPQSCGINQAAAWGKHIRMVIAIPKGTKGAGAYVGTHSNYGSENEFMLARQVPLRIHSFTQTKGSYGSSQWVLNCTVEMPNS